MNRDAFAELIDKRKYPFKMTKEEQGQAKAAGLLVVWAESKAGRHYLDVWPNILTGGVFAQGTSLEPYEGEEMRICRNSILPPNYESVLSAKVPEEGIRRYFADKDASVELIVMSKGCPVIDEWSFKIDVPHSTFEIVETKHAPQGLRSSYIEHIPGTFGMKMKDIRTEDIQVVTCIGIVIDTADLPEPEDVAVLRRALEMMGLRLGDVDLCCPSFSTECPEDALCKTCWVAHFLNKAREEMV